MDVGSKEKAYGSDPVLDGLVFVVQTVERLVRLGRGSETSRDTAAARVT